MNALLSLSKSAMSIVVLLATLSVSSGADRESSKPVIPRHSAKSFERWISDLQSPVPEKRSAASNSLNSVRYQVVPWLLTRLKTAAAGEESAAFIPQAQQVGASRIVLFDGFPLNIPDDHRATLLGFCALGTNAQEAIPDLITALSSEKAVWRQTAAIALGSIGRSSELVLAALESRLKDSALGVRNAAIYSLSKLAIDDKEIRRALVALANSELTEDALAVLVLALERSSRDYSSAVNGIVDALLQYQKTSALFRTGQLSIVAPTSIRRLLDKASAPDLSSKVARRLYGIIADRELSLTTRISGALALKEIWTQIPQLDRDAIRSFTKDVQDAYLRELLLRLE